MKPRYLYPKDYYADPSANVFNGKLYVYPSHDWEAGAAFDDDGGHFQMKDYHVISMEDVENGEVTDYGKILDVADVKWAEKQMWDNDCVEKDGKYYLIFSAKDYNGVFHLGVAIADKPEGPFVPQEHPIRGSFSIDPSVFKDEDGQIYCYFGGLWGGQLQWYQSPKQLLKEGGVDLGPAADKKTQLFAPADVPALSSFHTVSSRLRGCTSIMVSTISVILPAIATCFAMLSAIILMDHLPIRALSLILLLDGLPITLS